MKKKILQFLLKRFYLAPTDEDFIKVTKAGLMKGGEELTPEQVRSVKTQANSLKDNALFQDLLKSLKYNATQSIYYKSSNVDDIIFGKVMLYVVHYIESKIQKLS